MRGMVQVFFFRFAGVLLTWFIRLFSLAGLIFLAVMVGMWGGLWIQSDRVTLAALATTGLSFLDGHIQGSFYWIARVVIFALMLAIWVISCFVVVWLYQLSFGFSV